ncbi:sulfotransferase [Roseibium sp. CAU 1637]|uniref:Sulfotransferase n=1 Tax=Roseibium limicola TaxID=2816037 RepID=A0A939J3L4_9HYPH|nr:sulfotransferase [Roseibium limicola]MBO0343820.1 sulfotransferase [Roseibium limicola]
MTNPSARLADQALALQHSGQIEQAAELFREVLQIDPRHPQANFSLGIVTYQAGELGQAINHFRTAAAKAKKHPQIFQLLGLSLLHAGDYEEAQRALQKAISLAPKMAELYAQLGEVHRMRRKPVMARANFETALKMDPSQGHALIGLGHLEVSLGNLETSYKYYEKAIEVGSEWGAAYHRLAFHRSHKERPDFLDDIEKHLDKPVPQPPQQLADLNWAAAKIHSDLGDVPKAVDHFRAARKLHYDAFDIGEYRERVAFMKELFTPEFFQERQEAAANDSDRPVFIFGMPRSGTTLVEQIIARHSQVTAGGELGYFRHAQESLGLKGRPSAALAQNIRNLGPREFRKLARDYLKELDSIDKRTRRVTDKMPHNFEMLWLMTLLFPKATFIHTLRSPADICISLLSHAMSKAHNYARDEKSAGEYVLEYAKLVSHWQKVLPTPPNSLVYEKLVYNQEEESRRLIDLSGLEWQEECLAFYRGETPVNTFSDVQVRRPIFRSSIGRWKKYQHHMESLFEALGPLAPREVRSGDFTCDGSIDLPPFPDISAANDGQDLTSSEALQGS